MKKITAVEPYLLCKGLELQEKVKQIIIPGQEDKITTVKKVYQSSLRGRTMGIQDGDIVVTLQPRYLQMPAFLTEDDRVPFDSQDTYEIIDPSQVKAIYREEVVPECTCGEAGTCNCADEERIKE